MTSEDLERAKTAFILAQKDLEMAIDHIEDDEQHQNVGLHMQQATEKLIKALIHLTGGKFLYRKGHIMGYLREELDSAGGTLDPKFEVLDALEIYAVDGRYLILSDADHEDLKEHRPLIEELLSLVAAKITMAENDRADEP